MSDITQEMEIVSGKALDNLEACACYVSSWLAAGAPNTKPKSATVLIAEAVNSNYAIRESHAIGHIAVKLQQGAFELTIGSAGRHGSTIYKPVPHYTIESLVVEPGQQGLGVGSMLMKSAIAAITSQLHEVEGGDSTAVVSALACDASWPLFKSQGFEAVGHLNDSLALVQPYLAMDMPMNAALGKTVVSRIVGTS